MRPIPRSFVPALAGLCVLVAGRAQSLVPPEPIALDSLAGFKSPAANWQLARGIAGDPRHEKRLVSVPGVGVLVDNPTETAKGHLVTKWEHGDIEVDLDFLLTPGSNAGVYLQGRYEGQLFDSWAKREATALDCGAIYERWDD